MVQRLTLRRRLSYNTKSNKRRMVKTPGGRLVYLYLKKPRTVPRCGQCKQKLRGITPSRPSERPRMCRRLKTVTRTFGGVFCHRCLRDRIIRSFLLDEQKVVKAVMAAKIAAKAAAAGTETSRKIKFAEGTAKPAPSSPQKSEKSKKKAAEKAGKAEKKSADKKKGDKKAGAEVPDKKADKKPEEKKSTDKKDEKKPADKKDEKKPAADIKAKPADKKDVKKPAEKEAVDKKSTKKKAAEEPKTGAASGGAKKKVKK